MSILKKTAVFLLICLVICYLGLYLAMPYFLNRKDYSGLLTKNIKNQTGLTLVVHKYKFSVAPNLDVSLKAEEIQGFYPDKKQFMDIKNPDISISTIYLLKKEFKINKIKADEFQFSTKLLKNGKTTFQQYMEKHLKQDKSDFNFSKIFPKINIKKYVIKLKDDESGQKFTLRGDNFKITQNIDFNYVNFDTGGELYCFDKKFVKYSIKLAVPKVLFSDINNQFFDLTVDELYKYNLYAEMNADVKVHEKDEKITYLSGKINIDNFSLQLGAQKLPPSYFHINLDKGRAALSSKFYTAKNESSDITADIKLTKPFDINMKCKCEKAQLANLQKLAIPVMELLKIKNNLNEFKTNGTISADFEVKTDFKTLHSNGSLKIKNANITHNSIPLKISGINALVDFSNNSVKIKQSDILINNQPVKVSGTIDSDANGDIIVVSKNLDLNHILNAFPFLKLQKNLVIKSGKLSFTTKIKGKLSAAVPQINALVTDFCAADTVKNIKLTVKEILIDAKTNKDKYSGVITLKNILCYSKSIPASSNTISIPNLSAKFDNKNLDINPSKINAGNAKLIISGGVKDYSTAPKIILNASGTVDTTLIKSFAPVDIKLFSKGYLPVKALLLSDTKDTKLKLDALANPDNYITPVLVKSFDKTNTLTSLQAKISSGDIIVEDLSLYYANGINGLTRDINKLKLKKAISVKGKIHNAGQKFDNFHIYIPDSLSISIPGINSSNALLSADITVNGNMKKPVLNGVLAVSALDIPQYYIKAQSAVVTLNKSLINAQIKNLKIKGMDISVDAAAPYDALTTKQISSLKLSAGYVDMDYLMALMQILPFLEQSKYAPGAEFPYIINNGKLNIKSFKMGQIKANNVTADLSSKKNILYIKKMFSDAYGGKAAGNITYNFPYNSIHAEIQGRNMDAASAAKDFLPKEQKITGRLNFDASVDMLGTSYEQQMKTLKGKADVLVNNAHLGQLGRFEHFLYAQNLLSQRLIYASLNSAKQAISPKDTGFVTYLKGVIRFSSGYAHLNPVLTAGPQMSMYITGYINLLNNYTDLQILGKVSSEVSSSTGLLGSMTIKDFLDEHTKYGSAAAKLFNSCNSEIPEMDLSKIPSLSPDYKYQTKNFRVLIEGDPDNVSSVKSFTWVNPIGTKRKLIEQNNIKSTETKIENNQRQSQENTTAEQNTQPRQKTVTAVPSSQPGFLDSIPDYFHD